MRLADRLGIVVLDEVPAVGLFQLFNAALNLTGDSEEVKAPGKLCKPRMLMNW